MDIGMLHLEETVVLGVESQPAAYGIALEHILLGVGGEQIQCAHGLYLLQTCGRVGYLHVIGVRCRAHE